MQKFNIDLIREVTNGQRKSRRFIAVIIYIRDDLGHVWFFGDGSIRCMLAELELNHNENGYPCSSLEDGIKILNDEGYITGIEYNEEEDDSLEYFTNKAHAEDW